MAHHAKTGNDSATKFAVVFVLLFFFGVTVAGQQVFVGDESANESGAQVEKNAHDGGAAAVEEAAPAPEKHKAPGKKKH